MNPMALLKLKQSIDEFKTNHPKFPLFIEAAYNNALTEGTIIEFNVKSPDGKNFSSNIRLNEKDIELIKELKNLL